MALLAQQTRASSARESTRRRPKRARWKRYSPRTFYLFIAPWIIGFLTLTLLPMIYALVLSFTDFDGISGHWHWIGLANYSELLRDPNTWHSLDRTLLFAVIGVPLNIIGSVGLAVLVNQRLKAVGFFRTIFYIPAIVPVVASAIMWRFIFDRDAGALNALLERLHIPIVAWLVDPMAFTSLIIMTLWGMGIGMVIMLAGLQGVPGELLEAAQIDGASRWQGFWQITLPQLTPVLFFQVITGVIASIQTLVQPLLLAESDQITVASNVPQSNYLYMVNVYQQFFGNLRFGYGSAMLWVLFLIILGITLLVFRSSSFWVYYEVERD